MSISPKKVVLSPKDDVDAVIAKLKKSRVKEVTLVVPRGSVLGGSLASFQALKQDAIALGKTLAVESVDEHVEELAALAGIASANPIFKTRARPVYDIIPRKKASSLSSRVSVAPEKEDEGSDVFSSPLSYITHTDSAVQELGESTPKKGRPPFSVSSVFGKLRKKFPSRIAGPKRVLGKMHSLPSALGGGERVSSRHKFFGVGIVVVLLLLGWWISTSLLPRATVTIVLKEYPVQINDPLRVSVDVQEVSVQGGVLQIPGEILTAEGQISKSFPAAGREEVREKAAGVITIYNVFSSAPQTLVVRTRFETPDGKIFRIRDQVMVPGADVVDGEIESSSVDVEVIANEPGEAYNIGAVTKWTIPGFKGSARFEGFFGSSDASMTGGFVGERASATESEIASAKERVRAELVERLGREVGVLVTPEFEVLDDSTEFTIVREKVQGGAVGEGTFTVTTDATLSQFVFRRDDVRTELIGSSRTTLDDRFEYVVDTETLTYEDLAVDVAEGEMILTAVGNIIFKTDIDIVALQAELPGKRADGVKEVVFQLPGLERTNVSLWPFWVRKVPTGEGKLTVVLE